ncbi:helix-turn-helix domain-containing protein [Paucilactobacillus nenjiangensis]|jgi:hypothetical protein|uniref:helix-turn-helix domain-containing protein n=1 Tax=Paucilactobacillus nenjiangensis TaxID=1296540 RepID=UPI003BAFFB89
MGMLLDFQIPPDLETEMKKLWLSTCEESLKELIQRQQSQRWLNQQESAKYLHVSVKEFKRYADIPKVVVGGVTRWDKKDLDEYYQNHKI